MYIKKKRDEKQEGENTHEKPNNHDVVRFEHFPRALKIWISFCSFQMQTLQIKREEEV